MSKFEAALPADHLRIVDRIGDHPDLLAFAETAFDAGIAEGAFPPDCPSPAAHHSAAYAHAGGAVSGLATYICDGHALHVELLWVAPAHRCQGIGGRLLAAIIAEAERAGLPVKLGVLVGNTGAARLYRRLGFVAVSITMSLKS